MNKYDFYDKLLPPLLVVASFVEDSMCSVLPTRWLRLSEEALFITTWKSWDWEEENLCKEQESVESNKEPTLDLLRNGRHVANLTLVGQPIKQESSCWSTAADSNLQFRSKLKANVSDGWCWLSLLQVVHTWRWLYLKKKRYVVQISIW